MSRFFSGDPVDKSRFFGSDSLGIRTPDAQYITGIDLNEFGNLVKDSHGLITGSPFELEDLAAQNQGALTQVAKSIPRVIGSTALKFGQGAAMLGSAVYQMGVHELARTNPALASQMGVSTGDLNLENITDNAIVNALFNAEEAMKESPMFKVYKPSDWDDRSIWQQLGSTAWWADELADGAAFALSSYIGAGAVGKLGMGRSIASGLGSGKRQAQALANIPNRALGLGAKSGTMGAPSSAMQRVVQGFRGGNIPEKIGQFADFTSQVGIMTANEALFEARDTGHSVQQKLLEEAGYGDEIYGLSPEEQLDFLNQLPEEERNEIKEKKGRAMQNTFFANMAAISFSNAIELASLNRLMGQGLRRLVPSRNLTGGSQASRKGLNLGENLYDQASVIERKGIQRFIGRGSRPRTIAGVSLTQAASEGLYEENIQNSISNISEQFDGEGVIDYVSDVIDDMVSNTFSGDKDAWKSIVTGAMLGGLMGVAAGNRKHNSNATARQQTVDSINEAKANIVNIKDNIYERDEEGNIRYEGGQPVYNTEAITNFIANQERVQDLADLHDLYEEAGNKEIASILWNDVITELSLSYMEAGFGDQLVEQIEALGSVKESELEQSGLTDTQSTDENGRTVNVQERSRKMLEVARNVKEDYESITSVIPDTESNSLRINSAVRVASRLRKLNEKRGDAEARFSELLGKTGLSATAEINSTIHRINALQEAQKEVAKKSEDAAQGIQREIDRLTKIVQEKKDLNRETLKELGQAVPSGLGLIQDTSPNTPEKIALNKQAQKLGEYTAAIEEQLQKYIEYLNSPEALGKAIDNKLTEKGLEEDNALGITEEIANIQAGELVELTDKNTGTKTIAPVQMSPNGVLTINGVDIGSNLGAIYSSIRRLSEQESQEHIDTQSREFRIKQLEARIEELRKDITRLTEQQESEVESLIKAEESLEKLQSSRKRGMNRVSEKILNDRITAAERLIAKTQEAINHYDDLINRRETRISELETEIEQGTFSDIESLRQELELTKEEYRSVREDRNVAQALLDELKSYYQFMKEYWQELFPNKRRVFEDYDDAQAIEGSEEFVRLQARVNKGVRENWDDPSDLATQEDAFVVEEVDRALKTGQEYSNFKRDVAISKEKADAQQAIVEALNKRLRELKSRGELLRKEIEQYEKFVQQLTNPGVFNPVKGQEQSNKYSPTVNGTYTLLDSGEFRAKKNISDGLFSTTGNSNSDSPVMQRWFKFTEQVNVTPSTRLLAVTIDHPVFGVGKEFDVYKDEGEAFKTKDNIKVIALEALSDPQGPGGVRPVTIDGEIVSTSLVEITPNKTTLSDFKLRDGDTMFHNRDGLSEQEISNIIEDYRQFTDNIKNNPTQKHLIPVRGKSFGMITENEGNPITASEAFGNSVPKLNVSTKAEIEVSGQRLGVEVGMGYVYYKGRPVPAQSRKLTNEEAQATLKALKEYAKIRNTVNVEGTKNLKVRGTQILDKIRSVIFLGKSTNPEFSTYFIKGERNFAFGNNIISTYELQNGTYDAELLEHLTGLNHQISLTHLNLPETEAYTSITGERYSNYSSYLMDGSQNNRQNFQVPVRFDIIPMSEDTNTRQIDGMYLFLGGQPKKSQNRKAPQTKTTPAQNDTKEISGLSFATTSEILASANAQQAAQEASKPSKKEVTPEQQAEADGFLLDLLGDNRQEVTVDGITYLVGINGGSGLIVRKDDTSKIIMGTSPMGTRILNQVDWDNLSLGDNTRAIDETPTTEVAEVAEEISPDDLGAFGEFGFETVVPSEEEASDIQSQQTEERELTPEDDYYASLAAAFETVEPSAEELGDIKRQNQEPISKKDIEDIDRTAPFLVAARVIDYNSADVQQEIAELERLVGDKALAGIVKGLIQGKAFGETLADGRILLSDVMTEGTAYHEAFHRVFSGIISSTEQSKVIQDWKNRNPERDKLTDFQVEEQLAEEFREYMLDKRHDHKPTENVFRRIWNFLRAVLGIPSAVRDRLFHKISTGAYRDIRPNRTIVGARFMEAPEGFSAVREEYGTGTERDLYDGLTYSFLEGLLGHNFNVDDVLNFNNNTLQTTDRNKYKLIFHSSFETAMNVIRKNKPELADQVAFFRANKSNIFENFNNHLKRYGITLKEEQANEVVPGEEGRTKDTLGIIESIEFNSKAGVPNTIKLMIASLPALSRDRKFQMNDLGLPTLSNYKANLAKLHNALAGLETVKEMRDKIVEMSIEMPEYIKLLNRLNIPISGPINLSSLGDVEVGLISQFRQQFDKANYHSYIQLIDDTGNSFFVDANSERAVDLIRQRWQSNFRELPKDRLRLVDGRYIFNSTYFQKKYKGKLDGRIPENVFNFYEDLGIIFTDQEAVDFENIVNLAGHFYRTIQNNEIDNIFDREQADVAGWANQLIGEELKGNFDATDNQHINSDGKTVYSINLNNYLTIGARKINKGKADYLYWNEQTKSGNPFTRNSHFLALGHKLEVVNLDGTKITDSTVDRNGKITSKLSRGESLAQQFTAVMNGIFPFIRQGDRKIEYGISLLHSNGATVSTRGLQVETLEQATEVFKGYLADEILSAWILVNEDIGSDIPVYNQAARELRFFKGIFKKSIDKRITDLINNNSLDRETAISRIDSLINEDSVIGDIQAMLERKAEQFFNEFVNEGVLSRYGDTYENQGLSTEVIGEEASFTKADLMSHIEVFTFNFLIGNIEQSKLFTGDVAFYKLKDNKGSGGQVISTSHDFFKRTSGLGGTGKTAWNEDSYNEWLSENKPRPDKSVIDGKIQTWVFNDVESGSSLRKDYFKALTSQRHGFTAKEANDLLSGYDRYDEADAQGYITLPEYREFLMRAGDWTQSQELVYQRAIEGETLTAEEVLTLPPLKPQYFGPQTYDGLYVPTFYKLSVMPLIPSVLGENSTLSKLNEDMLSKGVGIATFTSGNKVGKIQGQPFYNEQGTYNTEDKVIQELDYDFMKVQLDMSPEKHHKVTFGTQFRKLVLGNLIGRKLSGPISKIMGKNTDGQSIVKRFNGLVQQQIVLELADVLKRLEAKSRKDGSIIVNKVKLAELLNEESFKRNAPNNVIDDINEALGKERGVEVMVTRPKIESILMSIINNTAVHNKVLGDMLVQVSSSGFENKPRNVLQEDIKNSPWASSMETLKFYTPGPNGTGAMEVLLPHRFKELYGENVDIKDIDPRLLELVGFRIPTQGLNSMEAIRVKGFLPQEAGNIIVLPSEIVAKAGSDFDIDKLTVFLPNYKVTRNWSQLLGDVKAANVSQRLGLDPAWFTQQNLETLEREYNNGAWLSGADGMVFNLFRETIKSNPNKYRTSLEFAEYNPKAPTKEGVQNEIIRLTRSILLAPENFPSLISPVSAEMLQEQARVIRSLKPSLIEQKGRESYFDLDFIMETREAYLTGKDGVGITASNLTHHVLSQIADLSIAKDKTIINLNHNTTPDGRISLSGTHSVDNTGNLKAPTILDTISAFLNGFVDIAKDPFLKTINADTETAGIYLYLIRAGVPLNEAVLFMNQPIILDYLRNYKLGKSMFKVARGTQKSNRDIKSSTESQYGSESFDISETVDREAYLSTLSPANMRKAIKGDLKPEVFNKMQRQVLEDYLIYQKASNKLLELSRVTNSDTKGTGPSMETANDLLEQFEEFKQDGFFENVDRFESETIIGTFNKAIETAVTAYKDVFPILQDEGVREVFKEIKRVVRQNEFVSQDDIDTVLGIAQNDFISFLFQNSTTTNGARRGQLIESYFSGENSIPKQVAKLKGSRSSLRNNLLIQELYPILSSSENVKEKGTDFDNLKFFSRRIIKEHADDLTHAWEELYNKKPNLASQIFTFALLQSSFNNSPLEFLKYAPPKFTSQALESSIVQEVWEKDVATGNLDISDFFDKFFKNNWRNSSLVPYTKRGIFTGRDYVSFLSNDWSTITGRPDFKDRPFIKTTVKRADGTSRYLLFENTGEFQVRKGVEYPIFERVGMLGNGFYFKEYASDTSVITENRAPNDIVDSQIRTSTSIRPHINAMKREIMSDNTLTDADKGRYLNLLEQSDTIEQLAAIREQICK